MCEGEPPRGVASRRYLRMTRPPSRRSPAPRSCRPGTRPGVSREQRTARGPEALNPEVVSVSLALASRLRTQESTTIAQRRGPLRRIRPRPRSARRGRCRPAPVPRSSRGRSPGRAGRRRRFARRRVSLFEGIPEAGAHRPADAEVERGVRRRRRPPPVRPTSCRHASRRSPRGTLTPGSLAPISAITDAMASSSLNAGNTMSVSSRGVCMAMILPNDREATVQRPAGARSGLMPQVA